MQGLAIAAEWTAVSGALAFALLKLWQWIDKNCNLPE
jgi:hypothetical protein